MSGVTVTSVTVSPQGLVLAMLDGPRQRAYAKLQAEKFKLDALLAQTAAQAIKVDEAKAEYYSLVGKMTEISNRNQ